MYSMLRGNGFSAPGAFPQLLLSWPEWKSKLHGMVSKKYLPAATNSAQQP